MNHTLLVTFARLADYVLLFFVGVVISLLSPIYFDLLHYIFFIILIPFIWAPIEAFLLSQFRTTPGCFLFGIKLKEKITFKRALKRAFWREKKEVSISTDNHLKRFFKGIVISIAVFVAAVALPIALQIFAVQTIKPTIKGWVNYKVPEEGFSVDFPAEPFHNTKELNLSVAKQVITYDEYRSLAPEANASYSVSYIHLPLKVRFYGESTILKASLNLIPENGPTSKLMSSKLTVFNRYPALNFVVRQNDEIIQGRLVLANGTLYKLTVDTPEDQQDQEELHAEEFLDSFYLKHSFKELL